MRYRLCAGIAAATLALSGSLHAGPDKLVFADFEKVENGRPVSARGGFIQMYSYEESKTRPASFKGTEGLNPGAPELVRIKADDPNHAMKFDYTLQAPNQWTGVTVEIHGLPDADGKLQSEDVSEYKYLSMQVYATGIRILRLEVVSNESGKDSRSKFPEYTFEVKPALNTYRIRLDKFTQPSWVDIRVDPKDVLKKLTSLNLIAFCDQCDQGKQGMIIVDNIAFEK